MFKVIVVLMGILVASGVISQIPKSEFTAQAAQCETRGVWLNPYSFKAPETRQQTLDKIIKANLNTVFLASYTLSGNFGWSDKESFDAMLAALKSKGLSVHVWLSSMSRKGAGTQAEYTDVSEQEAQKNWCMDWLSSYPTLDGVHFDNLRYLVEVAEISKQRNIGVFRTIKACYDAVKMKYPTKFVTAFINNTDPFSVHKDDYLARWYKNWLSKNPTNSLQYNGTQYRPQNLRYDPMKWIRRGIIDAVTPGRYTTDVAAWKKRLPLWKSFLTTEENFSKVIFGISWYPTEGEISYPDGKVYQWGGYNAQSAVRQIKYARKEGMRGFSIFEFGRKVGQDDGPFIDALTIDSAINDFDAPFETKQKSCLNSSSQEAVFSPPLDSYLSDEE
ncbi:hypothetical protein HYW55_02685 [Candidatus Gottesmanbacteria bacterium]|nr:hypothetical protein [Candidatus Gottesmanbacteria bacterium]